MRGVEKFCPLDGFKNGFVRGAWGEPVDACIDRQDDTWQQTNGSAVEIVSIAGEVCTQEDGPPKTPVFLAPWQARPSGSVAASSRRALVGSAGPLG